jgi:hypothetical protein
MTEPHKRAPGLVVYTPTDPWYGHPERVALVREHYSTFRIGELFGYTIDKKSL